jgi:glycosyltransferase involved in cell wall biosynthesis
VAALREGVDIVHYHALGPGLVAPVPRLFSRAAVVQTVHGLDQQRAKWGRTAAAVLNFGCWTSARVPDATVVVSHALRDYYLSTFGRDTHYVCNGVTEQPWLPPGETLRELGVTPGNYVLFVGRLVPEKAPDLLVRAFAGIGRPDLRLVIVGGSSFTDEFVRGLQLLAAADPRIVFAGRLHGEPLRELYANAAVFVLPSDLEGMPLTLIEAAAEGTPLLTSDIAPHREMMGEDRPGRRQFRQGDLAHLQRQLGSVLVNIDDEREGAGAARAEVFKHYSWDRAAEDLAELYTELARKRARARRSTG